MKPLRALRRLLRHRFAAPLLVVALTLGLPGLLLADPILLDSYSIRLKGHILSINELFRPDQTGVANPYYRPLFTLLHELVDRLTGDSHLGQRLLALGCHALAACGLLRFAKALGLHAPARLAAVALFLVAPGNVFTAAWPVVGYWTLAAGLCWFAAADVVIFVRDGRGTALVRALLLVALSLLSSETGYHFAVLLPLLFVTPLAVTRTGLVARRARALMAWPLFLALAWLHYHYLETSAQGLASTAPLDRLVTALKALPAYLEGGLGGNRFNGNRLIAWSALLLALLGVVVRRRRHFFPLFAAAAAFPFAALGYNDRYDYFASGATALFFALGAPAGIARLASVGAKGPGSLFRLRVARRLGGLLPLLLLALFALQLPARIASLRSAGRTTAALLAGLDAHADLLADLDHLAFVNVPPTLKWAVLDRCAPKSAAELATDLARWHAKTWFCTDSAYFGSSTADLRPQGFRAVLHWDGGALVARPPEAPLGSRQLLPFAFLARGVVVMAPPGPLAPGSAAEIAFKDHLLARVRTLPDPLAAALLEKKVPGLADLIAPGTLQVRTEPLPARPGTVSAGLFNQQLVAEIELPQSGLFVLVTYLVEEDPLHRLSGDLGRFCDLFEAELDGARAPIVPVFYHGVGVVVPDGKHTVRVRPRPIGGKDFAAPGGG